MAVRNTINQNTNIEFSMLIMDTVPMDMVARIILQERITRVIIMRQLKMLDLI